MQDRSVTASANLNDKRDIVGERHTKGRGKKKGKSEGQKKQARKL